MTEGAIPRPFPWQASLWRGLMERLTQGRLPHALLFAGPSGIGKRQLAEALMARLLCEAPTEQGACGCCRACTLFLAGSHPDLMRIEPEEPGRDLGIGQVRELTAFQALKAQYAGFKPVLLEPADRLTVAAGNALLKTLEEPTSGTVLLLVSARPSALLPTLRSRCQALPLRYPEHASALAWLQSQLPDADAETLLSGTGGAPLAAVNYQEAGLASFREEVLAELTALATSRQDPVAVAAKWQGRELVQVLGWFYEMVADRIRACITREENDNFQDLSDTVDLDGLFRMLDRVQEAIRRLRGSANQQLLVEELLVIWTMLHNRRTTARRAGEGAK